ncbi:hypothetical protein, partial [Streptomyces lydicus]|uniref:hypothetical protein n=1 Tax=Streptomyces lydicus TaxID=47763 RepID=UPI00378E728B
NTTPVTITAITQMPCRQYRIAQPPLRPVTSLREYDLSQHADERRAAEVAVWAPAIRIAN